MSPKSTFLSHPGYTLPGMQSAAHLSDRDRRVLDFEGSWWLYPQPKDRAITEYLGMSATRYYQILRRCADDAEALEYAPLTVRRLKHIRKQRLRGIIERVGDSDGAG